MHHPTWVNALQSKLKNSLHCISHSRSMFVMSIWNICKQSDAMRDNALSCLNYPPILYEQFTRQNAAMSNFRILQNVNITGEISEQFWNTWGIILQHHKNYFSCVAKWLYYRINNLSYTLHSSLKLWIIEQSVFRYILFVQLKVAHYWKLLQRTNHFLFW